MATVTTAVNRPLRMDLIDLTDLWYGSITIANGSTIRVSYSASDFTDFTGSFQYNWSGLSGGTLKQIRLSVGGQTAWTVTGFSVSALTFVNWVQTGNTSAAMSAVLAGADSITGGNLNDVLRGYGGGDTINGGKGDDSLIGDAGADKLNGGDGLDLLVGGAGDDTLNGGAGVDTVSYADATGAVTASLMITAAQNTGGGGTDTFKDVENLIGSNYNDVLTGEAAANTLTGGGGADSLAGGAGKDTLKGGAGADRFVFKALVDSTAAAPDLISDFSSGDKIDLHLIDANAALAGDQAFHLGGGGGHAGDIVVSAYNAAQNRTVLSLYVNNDATVDAVIWLTGDHHVMTNADFVL